MVRIQCRRCTSSCGCYFEHCAMFLCHNPSCDDSHVARPLDHVREQDGAVIFEEAWGVFYRVPPEFTRSDMTIERTKYKERRADYDGRRGGWNLYVHVKRGRKGKVLHLHPADREATRGRATPRQPVRRPPARSPSPKVKLPDEIEYASTVSGNERRYYHSDSVGANESD